MAEGFEVKPNLPELKEKEGFLLDCAVCLQRCVHPAQLPCGHIFCFLCIKGFANQNKKCAMCRQEIPRDFTEHPHLLEFLCEEDVEDFDGGYQWFYEGRNGWWQYDERTSKDLESSYKKGEKTCELLIAGFLYIVDLENMLQIRRNDPARRRRVKRDFATVPKKGVAGLHSGKEVKKLDTPEAHFSSELRSEVVIPSSSTSVQASSSEEEVQDVTQRIESISLASNRQQYYLP